MLSFVNSPLCPSTVDPRYSFDVNLQKMTYGKQLLLEDLPFSHDEIQLHVQNGYIVFRNGLQSKKGTTTCVRCGNSDPSWFGTYPCARCGQVCSYCRKCIMMGRISSCARLISWNGPEPELDHQDQPNNNLPTSLLAWSGKLSEGQKRASARVIHAVQQRKELLVWAVCGAGKTEVLFSGIEIALQEGKRVCVATPRTDVVLELTPRLKAAFPTIPVASLYGGSPDRHLFAPLTITTTHQLLRFFQAFDTMIVDEVDAFPYSVDETLQYAVKQARKPHSAMIYLTATPSQKWQRLCRKGSIDNVTIPARFHRHPLPVPEFAWCGNWSKLLSRKKTLPKNVLQWLEQRLKASKQALLFIPKIELFDVLLPLLKVKFPERIIETVHAEDQERKEKVLRMRHRETSLLLTTTILERGVTFPNIDVAVLGAEDRIFTESALVQIAGRVGRSADYPDGQITFFHFGKTEAMVKARRQIMDMNQEAKKMGLVD